MGKAGDELTWRDRGWLPHAERAGAIYFVTFRLAGSLPAGFLRQLRDDRETLERRARERPNALRPDLKRKLDTLDRRRIERALDAGHGVCRLSAPELAALVADALRHFDGPRYVLGPWCVMPNHVHVLFRPVVPWALGAIMHTWKSYTTTRANHSLARSGPFWQREYFDRLIRSERELARCADYILSNPARAGLRDWQWVGPENLAGLLSGE
jgi:REP element-mobilizing transposase RayT